jgi:transposase, IS30 family
MANGGAGSATSSANGRRRWRVPGHWEGDLIKGAGNRSSVGTLVERTSRKVVLIKLTDAKAETARDGFAAGLLAVPAPLRLTLTYDQGKEMARHKELAALTGLRVYFADPHAPWQRGSNENTNGLLRQYLPKGTDLSVFSQAELDAIAARLNGRPRKTLGFATPDEVFSALVDKAANAVTARNAEGVRYGT